MDCDGAPGTGSKFRPPKKYKAPIMKVTAIIPAPKSLAVCPRPFPFDLTIDTSGSGYMAIQRFAPAIDACWQGYSIREGFVPVRNRNQMIQSIPKIKK
jgi:hypothetical protein